jgi:hypothetical protein
MSLVGCAADNWGEDKSETENALIGKVTAGRIVTTNTDGLRLRRNPTRENTKNIIGLIPKGTQVKIIDGSPTDGFYKVEVIDKKVRDDLAADSGWVFGEYLNGEEEQEFDPNESRTGTHDVPTVMQAKLTVSSCAGLKDDKGEPMTRTVEDAISGKLAYAVIAIDTNTFAYNMRASIDEVDAKSSFNTRGKKVKFKIVKTAKEAPDGGFTATICSSSDLDIPRDADGRVTLSVYAYW